MGISKTDIYSDEINRKANLAKAFAHPARFMIIKCLIETKGCIVNDLVDEIGLAQPTISQHLKELKSLGIIKGEIEGPRMCYCINDDVWDEIKKGFTALFNSYPKDENCCS